jgi:hypothetical protein
MEKVENGKERWGSALSASALARFVVEEKVGNTKYTSNLFLFSQNFRNRYSFVHPLAITLNIVVKIFE